MNIGKTNYKFQINTSQDTVKKIIEEWLNENKFTFENKYGEDLYYHHDAWNGNRGFQYVINNNEVSINAWTIGIGNKFYMLDSGAANNMAGDSYKKILAVLFEKINKSSPSNINQINNISQSNEEGNISQVSNNLNNEVSNTIEKQCEIGFWLSVVGLVLSFFGYIYGIVLECLVFVFAIRGLKSRKRTKAIISIVLSIISIIIILVKLLG